MQWEHLTVPDLAAAVKSTDGLAVLTVGVIEPHAAHLPLGQDMLAAHWLACQAAQREPAVVFPAYPWGINHEGAHLPGAIVLRRDLVLAMLENVCDEIGRNGFGKILLLSGHGGNRFLLPLFVQSAIERPRPYTLYLAGAQLDPDKRRQHLETDELGHACEWETSMALGAFPELVRMENVPDKPFTSLRRNAELQGKGIYTTPDWHAMYPTMYVGDASKASAEKGKALLAESVDRLVGIFQAVKSDTVAPGLTAGFQARAGHPAIPPGFPNAESGAG